MPHVWCKHVLFKVPESDFYFFYWVLLGTNKMYKEMTDIVLNVSSKPLIWFADTKCNTVLIIVFLEIRSDLPLNAETNAVTPD